MPNTYAWQVLNLDADNFTPFPNLTQVQVEGWVEQQIAEQIAPTSSEVSH